MTGLIYALHCTCHDDGVRYVGQTTQSLTTRLTQHRQDAKRGNTAVVYKWMRRHGPQNIRIDLLETIEDCTVDQLNAAETRWITHHRSLRTNLLNMWAPFIPPQTAQKTAIPA